MAEENNNGQVKEEKQPGTEQEHADMREDQKEGEQAPEEKDPKDTEKEQPLNEEQWSGDVQSEAVTVEKLQETVNRLEGERDELKNRLLRVQADYDNYRRRTKEERTADAKYRVQSLAERLLPVLDNFERALNVEVDSDEGQSVLKGMEIVYRQLVDAFEAENIREIEAEGQPFDPQFHQAVMQVEHEDYEANTVVEVMQKGYMLNDRVIRPAMVKVTS